MNTVTCDGCLLQIDPNDCTRTFANNRWYYFCRECERNGNRNNILALAYKNEYIARLEKRIETLEERLSEFESKTGFMNAETMYHNAELWIVRNPRAWAFIKQRADKCVHDGHRFSMKRALEELRDSDLVNRFNEGEFKISNSLASVLTRFLIEDMPEVREVVTLRHSKVDRLFR